METYPRSVANPRFQNIFRARTCFEAWCSEIRIRFRGAGEPEFSSVPLLYIGKVNVTSTRKKQRGFWWQWLFAVTSTREIRDEDVPGGEGSRGTRNTSFSSCFHFDNFTRYTKRNTWKLLHRVKKEKPPA